MMVALGLLATFALVAVQLMTTSIKLTHDAAAAQDRALRFEAALAELRRDVWGATRVEAPSAGAARVTLADGSTAVWSTDAAGGLARTVSAPEGRGYPVRRAWSAVAPGLTFGHADGVLLLVQPVAATRPRRGRDRAAVVPAEVRRMPIVSQLSRGAEGKRP